MHRIGPLSSIAPTARPRFLSPRSAGPSRGLPPLARRLLGGCCLGLGVVGLVILFLPGWLLLGIGAALLAPDLPIFGRLVGWIDRRFPRLGQVLARVHRWLGID